MNRSFPIQNLQSIPADILAQWRQQYIDSNGTLNPATQLVPNPFQPSSGPLRPFAGALGAATIARQNTLFPYPLLIGSNAAVNRTGATADYHAMQLRVSRRFSGGMMMDANYTWSKNIDNTDNVEDNQGFNAGGSVGNYDIFNTQFSGAYTGNLGATVVTANPALGLAPGMGNANNFGTRGMATYNPRQIQLRAALRF